MNRYIALFRGINVGGKNILPMKELKGLLEALGLSDVATYIQSGNVVFDTRKKDTAKLRSEIRNAVEKSHRFRPDLLLLTAGEVRRAAAANPFPKGEKDPKTLHLFFLESKPKRPDLESLEAVRAKSESFKLDGTVFYLHAPDGIGRSKLAAKVERAMGVAGTGRNWRTVTKIIDLAEKG